MSFNDKVSFKNNVEHHLIKNRSILNIKIKS